MLDQQSSIIHVDFDECVSYFGGYNEDYSEFTGDTQVNPLCSVIQLVGGNVYRSNPQENTHSCTPGFENVAMCVSGLDACEFEADNDRAVRFDVLVIPGPNGLGSIDGIQFYSQAPDTFSFVDGMSGPNNFPSLMGLRVLANGVEIFRQTDIPTARTWTLRDFDFSSVGGFRVDVPTLFSFEILPYCLGNIQSDVMAWDIDELTITGGCNNVNGGSIEVAESTTICYPDTQISIRSFDLEFEIGNSFAWLVTDTDGEIVALPDASEYDFNLLDNGIYKVYHLAFDSLDFSGVSLGDNIESFEGCFDLSNEICISNDKLVAGELSSDNNTTIFVCTEDSLVNTINLELSGSVSLETRYLLLDSDSTILISTDVPSIDMSIYPDGLYSIIAISHNGGLSGAEQGNTLDDVDGCIVFSNSISVEKALIDAGEISFDGENDFQACSTSSFELNPTLTGNFGGINRWVLYTPNGMIVSIQEDLPIDISMMLFPFLRLSHIAYLGSIEGLELGENIEDLTGCFDFSNELTIGIPTVDGGTISSGGLDSLSICLDDPQQSMVEVLVEDIEGTAFSLVVTDSSGIILSIPNDNTIDFGNAGSGVCLIWNISFVDMLEGFAIGQNIADIVGCYDLSNTIIVDRINLEPSDLSAENGRTEIEICSGDGVADSLVFSIGTFTGPVARYVITDVMDNILEVTTDSIIDFEGVPQGQCFVYHVVSTSDTIYNGMDLNINSLPGCYVFSNPVSVVRTEVDGGSIMTSDSLTEVFIVTGDGIPDSIDVLLEAAVGDSMLWLVTDSLGIILEISESSSFDFTNAGPGTCLIWHLSFSDEISGLGVGEDATALTGCLDLSNAIIVNRISLNGGVLEFPDGSLTVSICVGDPVIDSIDVVLENSMGPLESWIITDTSGLILELPLAPPFVFEDAPGGICQIWHISYTAGLTGLVVGENVSGLSGAFSLSNALTVDRTEVDGGILMSIDSMTNFVACTGDGVPDILEVILDEAVGDSMTWVVTDTNHIILDLPDAAPFDFSNVPQGVCLLYNVSYYEEQAALAIDSSLNDLTGCFDLSNAITIERFQVDGGIISEASGLDTIEIIVGEGVIDSLDFSVIDAFGDSLTWVVTDSVGIILAINSDPPVDFESAGGGTCFVYHLAYAGGISGLAAGQSIDSLSGCFDLSNAIVVIRTEVNGGMIMSIDSLISVNLCIIEDSHPPLEVLLDGEAGTDFQWIITDTSGLILDLPAGPPFDFSMAPPGICQVWHLASIGPVSGLMMGENISGVTGIYDLSNAVEVIREKVNGGVLSHSSGQDSLSFITNDGIADLVDLSLVDTEGDSTQWIITDDQLNILALPDTLPFDFEGTPAGTCLIWNISFNLVPQGLEIDSSAQDLLGCFDLSNAITVLRDHIQGGTLTALDGSTTVNVCLSDTLPDLVDVILSNDTFAMNFAWVITDTSGLILDLPVAPPFDFSPTPAGICQIWHLAFQDNLTGLMIGNNVSGLAGSFDFSNPVDVVRDSLEGGSLVLDNGMTSDTIMLGDGIADTINVVLSGAVGNNMIFLVTDTLGEILDTSSVGQFDFESAGGGVCLIWNLSYADGIENLEVGNLASDLEGCFDLSNPVTIVRLGLMGGNLTSLDGSEFIQICLSDTLDDSFDVILTDTIGPVHSWVLTDTAGIIQELPSDPPFDFSGVGLEICQLWNLSHDTLIMGLTVGNDVDSLSGNFNFSNPITIDKASNTADSIMTSDSLTSITITVGDGIVDSIDVILEGLSMGDSTAWVITDSLGTILALPDAPPFEFESAGGGLCLIWHLTYSEGLSGLVVGNNVSMLDGCYELSNSIEVERIPTVLNGGTLTTIDGLTDIDLCIIEGNSDLIDVILIDNEGPNFQWVITDTTGLILGLPAAPPFDLSLAGNGLCQIWNLSFSSGLSGLDVGSNIDSLSGFFDLSNPIMVDRDAANGGSILTAGGQTEITVPVGEGVVDLVEVILSGDEGETQQWLITNLAGDILDFSSAPPFNFEDDGGGVVLIWNLSYSGMLNGLQVGNNVSVLEGCFDLSNSITVTKDGFNGGVLTDINGFTSTDFCITDVFNDTLEVVLSDTIGVNYQWIITDSADEILELPISDPFDLSSLPAGTCNIYNIAFDMTPGGLVVGDTLDNLTGIFHLSNALIVSKSESIGGSLTFADGSLIDTIEVGEGIVDTVEVLLNGNSGSINQWVVTDTTGLILSLPVSDPFDFEDAGGGVCLIWNLAFEAGLTGLMVGNNVDLIEGCYSFSNSITIVREGLSGGFLTFDDGSLFAQSCFGDGMADIFGFELNGADGATQEIILTGTNGQLLFINLPDPFDFESISGNIDSFNIYNISYDTVPGNYTMGNFIGNLTGNFALSNSILLVRDIEKAGSILDQDNMTSSIVIVADNQPDTIEMQVNGAFADSLEWLIVNEGDTIIGIQDSNIFVFDSSGTEECFIYHIGFNPNDISGLDEGQPIDSLAGCFSLSNVYTVSKKALNGGILSTDTGETELELCIGDGIPDTVTVVSEGALGSQFDYAVVNLNGLILLNQSSPVINMSSVQPGSCQIYCISHDGSLGGLTNGANIDNLSGCFSLSTPVDVEKLGVFGGNLGFQNGTDSMEVCVTDGLANNLIWMTTSVSGEYVYAITDTLNVIDTLIDNGVFDFEGLPTGECRIWGISYVGNLVAQAGDTVGVDVLVEDCFDISNDFLVVIKTDCTSPAPLQFSMYPNPAMHQITLQVDQLFRENSECIIANGQGSVIHRQDIRPGKHPIDLSGLSPGIYYLRIRSGAFTETQKFVILK